MTDVPFRIGLEGQPEVAAGVPSRAGWLVRGLLAVALVGAAAWLGYAAAFSRGLDQLHAAAQQRLAVEAAQLDGYLLRFEYLPSLLETSPDVYRLLGTPDDHALQQNVSLYLKSINLLAGADNLYVLSVAGDAIAAADFDQPGTPVGSNLSYRPYMRQALATGRGAFFGIGITSARAGYYLSYAVKREGQTIGVAVVKVNLDAFEREWRNRGSDMVLVDARGVTILASRDEWRLRPLTPLTVDALEEIATSKPYGSSSLAPLGWAFTETADGGGRVSTGRGTDYSFDERPLNGRQWRLLLLDDETPVRRTALIIGALSGLASIAALLALGLFAQRRREIRQRLASQAALQAANDRLEIRVQERTAELRAAQDELVHAGKLAVLGQMSAGLVHEINQPLAALQTTADNAIQFVDRGLIGEVRGNLVRIGELVRRLGRLTSQLRVFAYKSNEPLDAVSVEQALSETLKILGGRAKEGGVELTIDLAPGLHVTADQTRLEQLFCNIVANALDAVDGAAQRSIHIQAVREDGQGRCHIAISNSGPAIAPEVLQRLFEPFVTTKPAGKGLGLGLVLANHIARSFGGELQARNLEPAGAEFVVLLPLAD